MVQVGVGQEIAPERVSVALTVYLSTVQIYRYHGKDGLRSS